ncbi:hypothetical protein DYB32_010483, partial [Aphanomyces invadans]
MQILSSALRQAAATDLVIVCGVPFPNRLQSTKAMSLVTSAHAATTVVYTFDPATSGGVAGTITTLVGAASTTITADLDLTKANFTALKEMDDSCTDVDVDEFTWHIHTKWDNPGKVSEFLSGCSLARTANHYDPDFAC